MTYTSVSTESLKYEKILFKLKRLCHVATYWPGYDKHPSPDLIGVIIVSMVQQYCRLDQASDMVLSTFRGEQGSGEC